MEELLQQAGLTDMQAKSYLYLLKKGESTPPEVAKALNLTRSNAYKLLDKLVAIGLAKRSEVKNKFAYQAEDPIALSGLVANERNRLLALENGIKAAMHELRQTYEQNNGQKEVRTYRSNPAIVGLYQAQAGLKQPIYFIKSRADIPVMGHETMDTLRRLPAEFGTEQYGITPDAPEATLNPALDRVSNLNRTWVFGDDYTAPVEWTVSGDDLMIITFDQEASAVHIRNKTIARAFKELWHLLNRSLRANQEYQKLPQQAQRKA